MQYTITEYIKEYIENNIKDTNYYLNDIYVIIAYYLNISKDELFLQKESITIDNIQKQEVDNLLDQLYKEDIPLQYITQKQLFYNEEYFVNENVLIPRQDTEILVEKAIYYINKYNLTSLIDMCTGSGCIGISIANNSNIQNVVLVDISKEALKVASKNIKLNNVEKQIAVIESDLFKNLEHIKYDILVSNPPYIKTSVIASLENCVKKEPHLALDGGKDGMDIYIRILNEAKEYLNDNAILLFEIGYDQLEDILNAISKHKEYKVLECIKDLDNNDRVVICRFHQI